MGKPSSATLPTEPRSSWTSSLRPRKPNGTRNAASCCSCPTVTKGLGPSTPAPAWNAISSSARTTTCRSSTRPHLPNTFTPCAARYTRTYTSPSSSSRQKPALPGRKPPPPAVNSWLRPGSTKYWLIRKARLRTKSRAPSSARENLLRPGRLPKGTRHRGHRHHPRGAKSTAGAGTAYLPARPYQKVRDFVWCQEEPSNMGAWGHLRNRLGRLFATSFPLCGTPPHGLPGGRGQGPARRRAKRLIATAFGPRPILTITIP